MAAMGSMRLAGGAGMICVVASGTLAAPKGSVATPGARIVTPRAVITAPKGNGRVDGSTVKVPPVKIGAAVGSSGGHHHHDHHHSYHSGRRHHCGGYGAPIAQPYTGHARETFTWVSVPVNGATGGITHHAYYWHPALVPPLTETARRVDPAMMGVPPTPPTPPPSTLSTSDRSGGQEAFRIEDKALEAMRGKRYKRAARLYQQRWMAIVDSELGVDEGTQAAADRDLVLGALGQSHAEVLRLRAIALVGAGRHEYAARELARAYRLDPALAARRVMGKEVVGDAYSLRRLVNRSVRHAHRADDPGAWAVVAMLMRAEGRHEVARMMASRATEDGEQTSGVERPLSIFRD